MIHPYDLIGLPYRLGAIPERHQAADCLTLTAAVMAYYKIAFPKPRREWYRRLYRGDQQVFQDELQQWGTQTDSINIGTVALCKSDFGFGLASYFEDGWIAFRESEAGWLTIGGPTVVELYCPMNLTYVTS